MSNETTRRILVVDDEENIGRALKRSLRRGGYEVECMTDPTQALAVMSASRFDAVISDHLMPEMTGLELLGQIRTRFPDCVRLMLTGHADMQTAVDAINHGEIFRFVTKPWDDAQLQAILHIGFERQDAEREDRSLLSMFWRQAEKIRSLEEEYPGITSVVRDEEGAVIISEGVGACA